MKKVQFMCAVLLLNALTGFSKDYKIGNSKIERGFSVNNGVLQTIAIKNGIGNKEVEVEKSAEFRLRLSEGTDIDGTDRVVTSDDFIAVKTHSNTKNGVTTLGFRLENKKEGLTVVVIYSQKKGEPYIRKKLNINTAKPVCIERIDIDSLKLSDVYQPYNKKEITAWGPNRWKPGLGLPLFTSESALFFGTEFPASYNYVKDQEYFCGYLYGHKLNAGDSITTYSAVIGAGDDSEYISDAFYEYITSIRVRPLRLQTQYNSWFDYSKYVNKDKFSKSVKKVNQELCIKRGTSPLKAYVIDDGWQDSSSSCNWKDKVWPVNDKFDENFVDSHAVTKDANSTVGIWMSPGCNFGAKPAVPHMREMGWGALGKLMSLADSPYMDMLEARMVELTKQGVTYFKLDGLFGHLNEREFDLDGASRGVPVMPQLVPKGIKPADKKLNDSKYDEAKIYYLTVGAERLMKIFAEMAKVNPDVYIVISNGAWLSPWWLMSADAVWMINAGDAAGGADRTAELVYRDGVYHQIWEEEHTQYPMNALFNHEPKKVKSNESKDCFRKYLYMNMSRGTGFIELYLKTFNLKEYDWDVLAEGLQWAEDMFPTFKRSRMHGGSPRKKEVYGYTAWVSDRGYISIHNPSDVSKEYSLTLDRKFGLIPGQKEYYLTSPLSDSLVGLNKIYSYGDEVKLSLKPREIRILNFDKVAKNWSKLKALQTRTKDDCLDTNPNQTSSLPIQPDAIFIGRWSYNSQGKEYSREFTEKGVCILRQGEKIIWRKSFVVLSDKKVKVANEIHKFPSADKMNVGSYRATRLH